MTKYKHLDYNELFDKNKKIANENIDGLLALVLDKSEDHYIIKNDVYYIKGEPVMSSTGGMYNSFVHIDVYCEHTGMSREQVMKKLQITTIKKNLEFNEQHNTNNKENHS